MKILYNIIEYALGPEKKSKLYKIQRVILRNIWKYHWLRKWHF